ncbi:PGF-CTERM sorting domain-containing protein [Halolamina sp. CBA1230]|uniref:PGF-CTERM sorting domain-containing protein n=1 Tax=Halolamina sp. CBA1230 TaxID=1853690 RepID=UPI0009A13804|nr:PGF-CTERM sorting domain-containing protein [Halolamina sp. CBA1230]QKY21460.1 PGF-CTERM sorting domain-containing protein [Halolamina sp. CBA1230]
MNTRHTAFSLAVVLLVAAVAPAAAATAPIEPDAVGDLTVTTAPASVSADAAVEAATTSDSTDSLVARSDVAVFRLDVAGVPAEADDDGTLLGDELALALQQTSSSVDTNATAKTLDAGADSEGVAVRATEDAVYVAVDLATTTFQQGNDTATAAVGDSFTATATVTDEVTDGENYTRTATFGVVEPSVNFADGVSEATAGETVEFTAATLLAPGTALTFSLAPSDGGEARTTTATVGADGRATGELAFTGFDADEEYTIDVTAEETDLNTTVTGTTQAAATETPASTDTATATQEPSETRTSGPGFGVVAALLALLGAGAVVGRRE